MKLLTFQDLKRAKGVHYSRDHLRLKVKAGDFPRPIVIAEGARPNCHRLAWLESEVDEWISRKVAERDTKVAA